MQTRTNIVISCIVGAAVIAVLALRAPDRGSMPPIATEWVPPDEAQEIAQAVAQLRRAGASQATHLGCVRAEFSVVDNLAPNLAIGVFQPSARYAAWIRFSSTSDPVDNNSDVLGMAIKLLGVGGEKLARPQPDPDTHDFLLASHPVFAYADVTSYLKALRKTPRTEQSLPTIDAVRGFVDPSPANGKSLAQSRNLLAARWWSRLPHLFGEGRAVKYAARACEFDGATQLRRSDGLSLRARLERHLLRAPACFEFMLQFQADPGAMPIEDATVEWHEVLAPFEPVALLTIPAQRFDSPEQNNFCDDLSFNPWHALADHRPLGGINRVRREIFPLLDELRSRRTR